jgi:hypothetical protein
MLCVSQLCQVATRGTAVYFVLDDLAHLNNTYQFSLSWFQSAFSLAIKIGDHSQHHAKSQVHDGDSVTNTENGLPRSPEPEEKANLDSRMQCMMDRLVTCHVFVFDICLRPCVNLLMYFAHCSPFNRGILSRLNGLQCFGCFCGGYLHVFMYL